MKKGILLVNLGSPDSPEPKDVKKYLGEFLMDVQSNLLQPIKKYGGMKDRL